MQPAATIRPQRKSGARMTIILVALLAAGLITFGIIAAVGKRERAATSPGTGSEIAVTSGSASASSSTPPVVAVTDAAVANVTPDAEPVAVPVDAGREPAQKDASSSKSSEKRMGRLLVRAFPILTVYVDNKKIHDTPVDMKLSAGKHKLRLVNAEVGKDETVTVTIEENKTVTIERN
jgi:hypothetical protein